MSLKDLSIIIPALNEAENLSELLPKIHHTVTSLKIDYQIIVVDEKANERTRQVVQQHQAILLSPNTHGYGQALWSGLSNAGSSYSITMDADISHPPNFITDLWNARHTADIIIASRYVPGGAANMPFSRYILSKVLNYFFGLGLGIPVRDMSSGYRLYSKNALENLDIAANDFDVLQEILVKATMQHKQIREIPFSYFPRKHGSSHARIIKFGFAYLRMFLKLWRLRIFSHKLPE